MGHMMALRPTTAQDLSSHSDAMSFIAFNDLYGFSLVWPHVPTVVTVLFRTQCLFWSIGAGGPWWPAALQPGPGPGSAYQIVRTQCTISWGCAASTASGTVPTH